MGLDTAAAAVPFELSLNAFSYTLIAAILGLLFVPLIFSKDPDVHPMALQHQSNPSPTRLPKQTAVHRAPEIPHGYPLKSGLSLAGDKAYTTRDGDLRDVWTLACDKGSNRLLSVKGSTVEEYELASLTRQIHVIGAHLRSLHAAPRIAISLPNDVENLIVSFACHLWGLPLLLLPYPASSPLIPELVKLHKTNIVVAAAGNLRLADIEAIPSLHHVLYAVEEAARDLDWSTPPGVHCKTAALHDIVNGFPADAPTPTPPEDAIAADGSTPALTAYHVPLAAAAAGADTATPVLTTFTHRHLLAGIATLFHTPPAAQRLAKSDVFQPLAPLYAHPARVALYTALVSGATVALNAVCAPPGDIEAAAYPASPTVIFASSASATAILRAGAGAQMELWHKLIHWFQARTLAAGRIPRGNALTRFNDWQRPQLGHPASRVRLLLTFELAGARDSPPLNSVDLRDLRVHLAAPVMYQLWTPRAAGPVCSQDARDYRVDWPAQMPSRKKGIPRRCAHFGGPTVGAEVWLRSINEFLVTDRPLPRGEVWVRGPMVVGGEKADGKGVGLGVVAKWRADGCLEYV